MSLSDSAFTFYDVAGDRVRTGKLWSVLSDKFDLERRLWIIPAEVMNNSS
ncbi:MULTISPECIES: hypothetical protein [Pseudomonas]|nr:MULTISPECIES: hypothetical protein [Pseudomonas]MDQ0741075.1 hypothetical protein [Pseudomonas sp. W4I3]MDQ0980403.1 hypothetical protein [Pseudomonas synxantha]